MPSYEVHIGEVSDVSPGPLRAGEPTPEIRSVFWRGEAIDENAAKRSGYRAWDEKYGPGQQPVQALVSVTSIAA